MVQVFMAEGQHGKYPKIRFNCKKIFRGELLELNKTKYKECNGSNDKQPSPFQNHLPERISAEHKTKSKEKCEYAEKEPVPCLCIDLIRIWVNQQCFDNETTHNNKQTQGTTEHRSYP